VPAPFANSLCGYRANGNPNISDNGDKFSKSMGSAVFEAMKLPKAHPEPPSVGNLMEKLIADDLRTHRPDLDIGLSRAATHFEQYSHLTVFPDFRRKHLAAGVHMARVESLVDQLPVSAISKRLRREIQKAASAQEEQDRIADRLKANMPEESFLKIDITIGGSATGEAEPALYLGLSSKWTLRTDRAQDCVSQGSKLAALRRGAMPHYAVITMESRPSMLRILADGSGSIDCVYHLNLPALARAIDTFRDGSRAERLQASMFDRMLQQRRLRDYDDLVAVVERLPAG
jgi:hypothetical protein